MTLDLGRIGAWFNPQYDDDTRRRFVVEAAALGYPMAWLGGGRRSWGELELIEEVLDATSTIAVATAIVNMWANDPAIWSRVAALLPGGLVPEGVLAIPDAAFRAAGLSSNKTLSIKDLAAKVLDGTVPLGRLRRMPDDEIVLRFCVVRGIGRWTVVPCYCWRAVALGAEAAPAAPAWPSPRRCPRYRAGRPVTG